MFTCNLFVVTLEAGEIVHRKLRMRLPLPWQKLKITSAIFSQTLNTKLVSPPVLIFLVSYRVMLLSDLSRIRTLSGLRFKTLHKHMTRF